MDSLEIFERHFQTTLDNKCTPNLRRTHRETVVFFLKIRIGCVIGLKNYGIGGKSFCMRAVVVVDLCLLFSNLH